MVEKKPLKTSLKFLYIFPLILFLIYSFRKNEIPEEYLPIKNSNFLIILWVPLSVLIFVSLFFFKMEKKEEYSSIKYWLISNLFIKLWTIGFLISLIILVVYCSIIIKNKDKINNELNNELNKDNQKNYKKIINKNFIPILGFSIAFILVSLAIQRIILKNIFKDYNEIKKLRG